MLRKYTLIELVICVGIIAVFSSLLLDNVIGEKSREAEELTLMRGKIFSNAMGGKDTVDAIPRFLSDMGRWPRVFISEDGDGDGGRRLAELYDPSIWYHDSEANCSALNHIETIDRSTLREILNDPFPNAFPEDVFYPTISMPVGWRGPYLGVLNPVKGNFFDGWGRPWNIITNSNLAVQANRLAENRSGENAELVFDKSSDFEQMRESSTECRIDGIQSENVGEEFKQTFLFPHWMNRTEIAQNTTSSLFVHLKVRDSENANWIPLSAIAEWSPAVSYGSGEAVSYNGKLYYCHTGHLASSVFDSMNFSCLSDIAEYGEFSNRSYVLGELCRYSGNLWKCVRPVKKTEVWNHEDWEKLQINTMPDRIGLLLFVPFMYKVKGKNRVLSLGYYHFFRNGSGKNREAVVAECPWTKQNDADLKEGKISRDYNPRYLVAEDNSNTWNEFVISRLIPGRRKIFCAAYSNATGIYQCSGAEWIELRPGENHITLYLERKKTGR